MCRKKLLIFVLLLSIFIMVIGCTKQDNETYYIGDTQSAFDLDWTVNSFTEDYYFVRTSSLKEYADDGRKFVTIEITVKNNRNEECEFSSDYWRLIDSASSVAEKPYLAWFDTTLFDTKIKPYETLKRVIRFQVSEDFSTKKPYTLQYKRGETTLKWILLDKTITYNYMYNDYVEVKKITSESDLITITPQRQNYSFDGWYSTPEFEGQKVDLVQRTAMATELYAKWIEKPYILYNYQYGGNTHKEYIYSHKELLSLNREGFTFDGWYYDETYSQKCDSVSDNNTIELFAKWTPINLSYTINYYLENADNNEYSLFSTYNGTGIINDEINAEIKEYSHFSYNEGKSNPRGFLSPKTNPQQFNLFYDRERFSVNFVFENASSNNTVLSGEYKYEAIIPNITTSIHLGYDWDGWYSNESLVTHNTTLPSFSVTQNKDYHAKSNKKKEMVNFMFSSSPTDCTITGIADKTVTEITVPTYVTNIAGGAFSGLSSLVKLTIPFVGGSNDIESTTRFGYIFGTENYYQGKATNQVENITYYIPKTLKEVIVTGDFIPNAAFIYCDCLETIVFTGDISFIPTNAFFDCKSLVSLIIPNTIKSIGISVFSNNDNLFYNVYDNGCYLGNEENPFLLLVKPTDDSIASLEINANTKLIYGLALIDCNQLTNIILPNELVSLTSFIYSNSIVYNEYDNGYYLGSIDNPYLLFVKTKTKQIDSCVIHEDTKYIYSLAFANCTNLTEIEFPDNVTIINDGQFFNCGNLSEVTFNKGIITINGAIFEDCYNLSLIVFNGTIEEWNAIEKSDLNSRYSNGHYIIHCQDGDIVR